MYNTVVLAFVYFCSPKLTLPNIAKAKTRERQKRTMTTEQLARVFGARKEHGSYRARCPIHETNKKSGRALAFYPKSDKTKIVCHAGCDDRDILAYFGLRIRDLFYHSRDLSSEQLRALYQERRSKEQKQRKDDLSMLVEAIEFGASPRRKTRFECDIERFCARFQ